MLFIKPFKTPLLIVFILLFTACANKTITKEELSLNPYFLNTSCHKEENSNDCIIKSRIIKINDKEINPFIKDETQYFKLQNGINIINIESEFHNTAYIFESKLKIDVKDKSHYTLKYNLENEEKQIKVRYQLLKDGKIIKEFTPTHMRNKDKNSISSTIKEYGVLGLQTMFLILNIAANIVYISR